MSKYNDMAKRALEAIVKNQKIVKEGRLQYDPKHSERVHPTLSTQLRARNTSLGAHPAFPASDESHFEEKLISKRFLDVLKNYKRVHEVDTINPQELYNNTPLLIDTCIDSEKKHKKELEELAIRLIREEYDMGEDDVDIEAQLTTDIDISNVRKNPAPIAIEGVQFENHESIANANDEVYKRRFINAMIQGAAMKTNHMFHLVEEELMDMDHKLPQLYSKLMTSADYAYLIADDNVPKHAGGLVRVEFPKKEGDKPKIIAQAMTLPVLIHELVKGTMELLASHGLPKDRKITEYVLGKADFMAAETWDMRLGPAIWEKFTEAIEPADFNLKHHIFHEMVSLPVKEFNIAMREIMAGTNEGKKIISDACKRVKDDMINDDFNLAMENVSMENSNNDTLKLDDLDGLDWDNFM